jgi:hypothetical protein
VSADPLSPRRTTLPAIAREARSVKARARFEALPGATFGELEVVALVPPGRVVVSCARRHARIVDAGELRKTVGPRRCASCSRLVLAFGAYLDVAELARLAGVTAPHFARLVRAGARPEDLLEEGRRRRPLTDGELLRAVRHELELDPGASGAKVQAQVGGRRERVRAALQRVRAELGEDASPEYSRDASSRAAGHVAEVLEDVSPGAGGEGSSS